MYTTKAATLSGIASAHECYRA
ncbi:hypothetical protein [Photobacterium sanguinicancri]